MNDSTREHFDDVAEMFREHFDGMSKAFGEKIGELHKDLKSLAEENASLHKALKIKEDELADAREQLEHLNTNESIDDRMRDLLIGQKRAIARCDKKKLDELGLCECMHRLRQTLLEETAIVRNQLKTAEDKIAQFIHGENHTDQYVTQEEAAKLRTEIEQLKKTCCQGEHDYGDDSNCSRCDHYGPGVA